MSHASSFRAEFRAKRAEAKVVAPPQTPAFTLGLFSLWALCFNAS